MAYIFQLSGGHHHLTKELPIRSWFAKPAVIFGLVAIVYFLTILLNDGFMATDEYFTGITRYIPAQTADIHHLVFEDDVKSPLQILPMHLLAQTAYQLGISQPYWQYRFTLAILALINCTILGWVFWQYHKNKNPQLQKMLWLLFGFFFVAPFAFTRPMFESLAAPWIALTALYGSRYDENGRRSDLLKGVVFVSIAFVMRQQVGICALALIALTVLKKNWKDFFSASALGLFLFIISGIPDYFLRGSFHHSLRSILDYNVKYGASYATHPIYTYPVLIFVLCLGPWWIMKYPAHFWREHFRTYRTEWLLLLLFVILHSCFPQKWERFLISMVPLFLIMLAPLLQKLWSERAQRPWRLWSLLFVNGLLFFPATFFPPQKNLISLSLYLDKHPEVTQVYRVDNTPEWITDAFIRSPKHQFKEITQAQLPTTTPQGCQDILVVAEFLSGKVDSSQWVLDETMKVNLIEAVAYKLNQAKNIRRAPLAVFKSRAKECQRDI